MKNIVGYEGIYGITSCGKVWSYRRKKFLKPVANRVGYFYVNLCINGNHTSYAIHRLVAEAFIPNKNKFEVVNHINGITTDNRVENLEWCSRSENQKHAYRIGLEKPQRGEDNKNSKLSKEQVLEIRRIYKKRDRERGGGALARRFGVSDEAIRRCVNGVTWKYT